MARGLLWFREKKGRSKDAHRTLGDLTVGACLGEKVVQRVPF